MTSRPEGRETSNVTEERTTRERRVTIEASSFSRG
jgi:hypothetical protein